MFGCGSSVGYIYICRALVFQIAQTSCHVPASDKRVPAKGPPFPVPGFAGGYANDFAAKTAGESTF